MIYWTRFMFGMHLVSISIYTLKIHIKLHSNFHKEFASICIRISSKSFQFYPHLSLETISPAVKPTENWCINMKTSFLGNRRFNHKLAPSLLHTYQASQTVLTIWENMKETGIQIFQVLNSLANYEKSGSTAQVNIQISQPQFSIFLWVRKKFKVQPKTHFQNSKFWIKDEL